MSVSASIQREMMPRMMAESSTTIIRMRSPLIEIGWGTAARSILIQLPRMLSARDRRENDIDPSSPHSDQADFLGRRGGGGRGGRRRGGRGGARGGRAGEGS